MNNVNAVDQHRKNVSTNRNLLVHIVLSLIFGCCNELRGTPENQKMMMRMMMKMVLVQCTIGSGLLIAECQYNGFWFSPGARHTISANASGWTLY